VLQVCCGHKSSRLVPECPVGFMCHSRPRSHNQADRLSKINGEGAPQEKLPSCKMLASLLHPSANVGIVTKKRHTCLFRKEANVERIPSEANECGLPQNVGIITSSLGKRWHCDKEGTHVSISEGSQRRENPLGDSLDVGFLPK
jgi:hypothetical protein